MFHPECLDVHCSSFPPNTAKAGFTCPSCSKPIIPPGTASSNLVHLLNKHLETAPWLEPRVEATEKRSGGVGLEETRIELGLLAGGVREEAGAVGTSAEVAADPGSQDVAIDISRTSNEGIASRKPQRSGPTTSIGGGTSLPSPITPDTKTAAPDPFDADDDKYRKHTVMQLFKGFTGKESKPTPPVKKARPLKFSSRTALVVFALFSILATMIILHLSLSPPE
jgi:hypothetical protein